MLQRLLPADASDYRGPRWVLIVTALYNVVWTARSLVHVLAPDGGAHSIATIDTSVAGGDTIVAMFAQWGLVQLLIAGVFWVLLARYRGLLPLMLLVYLLEPVLRIVVGQFKPIATVGTAPGAVADWIVIPVMAVLLVLSLQPGQARQRSYT